MDAEPLAEDSLIAVAALGALALGGSARRQRQAVQRAAAGWHRGDRSGRPDARALFPAPGTAAHEDSEAAVTGANATKAQAAAVASVGGGTAGAVTTNYDKTGYEVTVTRSDGTTVDVHMDLSFTVDRGHGPDPGRSRRLGARSPERQRSRRVSRAAGDVCVPRVRRVPGLCGRWERTPLPRARRSFADAAEKCYTI